MNFHDITYFFKRKYRQIERVIDFLPIIWNGFDFDYIYSIQLFRKQLERQAKFMESDKSYSLRAKQDALKIRTAIRLMDKVYNDDYTTEWVEKFEEKYGVDALDWEWEETAPESELSYHRYKFESWENADEIRQEKIKLCKESIAKQKRAHKLLWDFIEHNLQFWWD